MKTQRRVTSKLRLSEDVSVSLLSSRPSYSSSKTSIPLSTRNLTFDSVRSPKSGITEKKTAIRPGTAGKATIAVNKTGKPERSENTGRDLMSKRKGGKMNSENQSLNNSVSKGDDGPVSLNTSRMNAPTSEILTSLNHPCKTPSSHPPKSRHCSIDLVPSPSSLFSRLSLPIPGIQAVQLFQPYLTVYERGEILDFPSVYYLRLKGGVVGTAGGIANFGFDDDRGDYLISIGDHIAYRYEITAILGRGSFGQVVKAIDRKTGDAVAVKVIRNKTRFQQQAAVEVNILRYLKERDSGDGFNVVHIRDNFVFRKHICITFELLTLNLYDFLKTNNFQGLSPALIKRFALQLLTSLSALKSLHIIHCDLKPENILLKLQHKSAIKIIDFGSSCFSHERLYTYIQSRFYRAPEIILGIPYTPAIDMWSFGCILAELAVGTPLFPGESESEQLLCIMQVKGVPPQSVLEQASRKAVFFDGDDKPKITANKRGKKRFPGTRPLKEVVGDRDVGFLDFLESEFYSDCLDWDPQRRLTPEAGLKHPWLSESLLGTIHSSNPPPYQSKVSAAGGSRRGKLSLADTSGMCETQLSLKPHSFTSKHSFQPSVSFF